MQNIQHIPWQKIQSLEEEIKKLQSISTGKISKKSSPTNILGILKGVKFTDKDLKEVKQIFSFKRLR